MKNSANQQLVERLTRSQIYRDYERAFGEATGLPLRLSPLEDWHLAHRGQRHENPFCALMAKSSRSCAACLETQADAHAHADAGPRTVTCFAGLCETSVPLRVGQDLAGLLQTGEIMMKKPTRTGFNRVAMKLIEWGVDIDLEEAEAAYMKSPILSKTRYEAVVRLLTIFGQHLSILAHQIMLQHEQSEPPNIARARQYIAEHHGDTLTLDAVAHAVNMSSYYFCKMFKKATGMNFTDYLSRMRVENARELLLNPNARVSEVAFESGFQSITNFNRTFKRLVGRSPTQYRELLPGAK
jgi:AraC-like DNA-binding protein/ligand-binding sensor protein